MLGQDKSTDTSGTYNRHTVSHPGHITLGINHCPLCSYTLGRMAHTSLGEHLNTPKRRLCSFTPTAPPTLVLDLRTYVKPPNPTPTGPSGGVLLTPSDNHESQSVCQY